MAELKVSMAQWRQEVVYLASFLRMLGANPHNLRIMALMMTRDAEPANLPSGDMRYPFFDWHVILPDNTPPYCLRNIPVIVACLARNNQVGIIEVDNVVHLTYKDVPVDNPRGLLRTLSKAREREVLRLLERRQSTNMRKRSDTIYGEQRTSMTRAPIDAISWGMAGRFRRFRLEWRNHVLGRYRRRSL